MASFLLASMASPGRSFAAPPDAAPSAAPPIALAITAGVATALIPLALGASHTAGAVSDASRDAGYVVAGAGFALAPVVAHVALGEWRRAAAFGAAPLAAELGIIALVSAFPDAVFHRTVGSRTAFALLFSVDVFAAALGLVDVMLAGDRARAARTAPALGGVTIVPSIGRDHGGILIGGRL